MNNNTHIYTGKHANHLPLVAIVLSFPPFRVVDGRGCSKGRGSGSGRGSSVFEGEAAGVASTAVSSRAGVSTGFGE